MSFFHPNVLLFVISSPCFTVLVVIILLKLKIKNLQKKKKKKKRVIISHTNSRVLLVRGWKLKDQGLSISRSFLRLPWQTLSSTSLRCWRSAVLGAEIKMKDSFLSASKPPTISNAGYPPHASVSVVLCHALTQTHQLMPWLRRLEYKSLFIVSWLTAWLIEGPLTKDWLIYSLIDTLTHPLTQLLTHEQTYYIRTYQYFQ